MYAHKMYTTSKISAYHVIVWHKNDISSVYSHCKLHAHTMNSERYHVHLDFIIWKLLQHWLPRYLKTASTLVASVFLQNQVSLCSHATTAV